MRLSHHNILGMPKFFFCISFHHKCTRVQAVAGFGEPCSFSPQSKNKCPHLLLTCPFNLTLINNHSNQISSGKSGVSRRNSSRPVLIILGLAGLYTIGFETGHCMAIPYLGIVRGPLSYCRATLRSFLSAARAIFVGTISPTVFQTI